MKQMRVLVSPGTTLVGLEILRSLRFMRDVEVIGAGTDPGLGEEFGYQDFAPLPPLADAGHIAAMERLVRAARITHVYPAHDDATVAYSAQAEALEAAVVTSSSDVTQICRDKALTYAALRNQVPIPSLFEWDSPDFPCFVKPRRGQGSRGVQAIFSMTDLKAWRQDRQAGRLSDEFVIQEFLPGAEFTVDCFSTAGQGLIAAMPRMREANAPGISRYNLDVDRPDLVEVASAIQARLGLRGPWFFQVKVDVAGTPRVTEVAPRIAGSSAIRRLQGVNLAALGLYEFSGERHLEARITNPITSTRKVYEDQIVDLPEFTNVLVDFDDTLLIDGAVNAELAGVLFGLRQLGKRIVLVSRHDGNLHAVVKQMNLGPLFDSVVHLRAGEPKSSAISGPGRSLLVDDSFAERAAASARQDIFAIDPSAIGTLWRLLK